MWYCTMSTLKDKFVYYIYSYYYFFFNYIYLLMILIFHKFKIISLSFESPFMHIKHLKYSRQIVLLDLKSFL